MLWSGSDTASGKQLLLSPQTMQDMSPRLVIDVQWFHVPDVGTQS